MKLVLFLLIAYGISNILIFGSIFKWLRNFLNTINPGFFGALIGCFICLPTWVGFAGSAFIWSPTEYYGVVTGDVWIFSKGLVSVFLDGCLTSGAVWLMHTFQESMERHFKFPGTDKDDDVETFTIG